jgi:hypothetical protein
MLTGASCAVTGPLARQLTDTLVEHRSLPLRPLGQVGDGEGRSGSKGGEGPARGGQSMSALSGSHLRGRVNGSNGRFERPWPSAVLRIVARRLAQCTRGASRAPTGLLGRQSTDTLVSIAPWLLRSLGQVGMARADRVARVAKGLRGAAIDVPAQAGLLFSADYPRLVRCNAA